MLTRKEKQDLSDPGTLLYGDLETMIMQNIIRHVKNYDSLIDSDTWLLQKLAEIGKLNSENMKLISKAAGLSVTAVQRMLDDTADIVLKRVEPGLNTLERQGLIDGAIPAKKSENVKKAIQAVKRQAFDSLNTCNTTMLYKARDTYTKLVKDTVEQAKEIENKQEFLDILGKHVNAQAIGAEARQQAIRNTIKEFNEKGIPAFVDKSGREWTPEAYVAMTLRSTAGNTATETMMARMDDRGLSLIQVSSHPGARPKCAKDQGKIFDRNNGRGYTTDLHGKQIPYYPFRESSYGEPDGLFGINCGHHGTPFIPGVSLQRYFPTEDMEENDKLYKKMQTQRSIERAIRKEKRLCMLYDTVGDSEAFEKAAVKLKAREAQMKGYLENNKELLRRRDREQAVGFDRGISARAVAANKKYMGEHFKKQVEKEVKKKAETIEGINKNATNSLLDAYDARRKRFKLNEASADDLRKMKNNPFTADYTGVSVKTAKAFNDTISNLSKKYYTGFTQIKVGEQKEFFGITAIASTSHNNSVGQKTLTLNPFKTKDYDKLIERVKELSDKGYAVKIKEEKAGEYIATHEFAHSLIDMESPLKNFIGMDTKQMNQIRKEIRKLYDNYTKEISDLEQKFKRHEMEMMLAADPDEMSRIAEMARKEKDALEQLKISKYSMQSPDEFMAEAFTQAIIGERQGLYSVEIMKIIEKYFGRK